MTDSILRPYSSRFIALTMGLFALPLYLSGCATTPTAYPLSKMTTLQHAAQWHAPLPHQGATSQLYTWWQQFNDPILIQLIQLITQAQNSSPTLAASIAKLDAARAVLLTNRSAGYPVVNATAQSTTTHTIPSGTPATTSTIQLANIDAKWEADLFGRIRHSATAADHRINGAVADWHAARVSLSAQVAKQYVAYQACQLMAQSLQKDEASYKQTQQLTQKGVSIGYIAPIEAQLSQAAYASSQSQTLAQLAQCEIQTKALVQLTGMDEPQLKQTLASAQHQLPIPAGFSVTSVPADLVNQRPDIASLEQSLLAAYQDIDTQVASQYPHFTLGGDITLTGAHLLGGGLTQLFAFAPSLTVPLSSAAVNAKIDTAKANYQLAYATLDSGLRQAILEVETALVNLNNAEAEAKWTQLAATSYASYASKQQLNWRLGGTTLLALQTVQRQASTAERSEITNKLNHVNAWIDLYKALGGGWDHAQIKSISLDQPQASDRNPLPLSTTVQGEQQ